MAQTPELPSPDTGEPIEDFHEQAVRETAENQGIFTPYDFRRAETGPGPAPWTDLPGSDRQPPSHSHRGGRSYPESDRDVDPFWNTQPAPLAGKELAQSQAASKTVRAETQLASDQHVIDQLHADERAANLRGETTHPAARWRAYQERRQRNSS